MTIEDIFERQVRSLAEKVRRLHAANGADNDLYLSIRNQVAGELTNHGQLAVVSAALGALCTEEAACRRLTDIVVQCSEHFYEPNRVLSAIVAPVAFRLGAPFGVPVTLTEGDAENLKTLGDMIKVATGSRAVLFDNRLYDKHLFYSRAQRVYQHLGKLADGVKQPDEGLNPCVVRSTAEPNWQMYYLVGVQVSDRNAPLVFNEESAQRRIANMTYNAVWALTQCKSVFSNKQIEADGRSHGIWYRNRGVLEGEQAIRGHRLHSLLANFDQGATGVKFYYVHEEIEFQVRLMITSHIMTVEHRWKLMGAEPLDGFRTALDYAIRMTIADGDVVVVRQVDQYDYQRLAAQRGLDWMTGVMR
jgi:hypothetical protein